VPSWHVRAIFIFITTPYWVTKICGGKVVTPFLYNHVFHFPVSVEDAENVQPSKLTSKPAAWKSRVTVPFSAILFRYTLEHDLFEYSQDSLACRCKSCMKMKMSIDHWWTDIDKAEPQYSEKSPVSSPAYAPKILHGMVRDRNRAFAMTERRVTTLNCTSQERQLVLITNFYQLIFFKGRSQ
jgi:hypothetical protein